VTVRPHGWLVVGLERGDGLGRLLQLLVDEPRELCRIERSDTEMSKLSRSLLGSGRSPVS
jgi:hypothetical protein